MAKIHNVFDGSVGRLAHPNGTTIWVFQLGLSVHYYPSRKEALEGGIECLKRSIDNYKRNCHGKRMEEARLLGLQTEMHRAEISPGPTDMAVGLSRVRKLGNGVLDPKRNQAKKKED